VAGVQRIPRVVISLEKRGNIQLLLEGRQLLPTRGDAMISSMSAFAADAGQSASSLHEQR